MREILFRGKRIDNGEWVKGDLIHEPFGTCIQSIKNGCRRKYKVYGATICQYTGLTDKNRRKIWENDIVETVYDGKQNPKYVVIWDEGELDFKATNGKEAYKANFEYLGCCDEIEVIGNIFDNPELMEEEQC